MGGEVDADDRVVELTEDDQVWIEDDGPGHRDWDPVLPGTTRDDTDAGWGERRRDNDDRLLADRPPHWD